MVILIKITIVMLIVFIVTFFYISVPIKKDEKMGIQRSFLYYLEKNKFVMYCAIFSTTVLPFLAIASAVWLLVRG